MKKEKKGEILPAQVKQIYSVKEWRHLAKSQHKWEFSSYISSAV